MPSPLISVVIPTFNASKFLREALDSLVAQTFTDWEAICVNDGSTDDSLAIMQEYAAKDGRFRILDGPNGGYGKAMNRGMDAAKGKYMAIFEPDDYLPPNAYKALSELAENNRLDIAKGFYTSFYGDGANRTYGLDRYWITNRLICPRREQKSFLFTMNTWTCLYNLEFLRAHGIRHHESPGASFQDNGWFMLTFAYADRVMGVPENVYFYRTDNPNSSSIPQFPDDRKMFTMLGEYAYIRRKLETTPEVWNAVKVAWMWRYIYSHYFIYRRLRAEYKLPYLKELKQDLEGLSDRDLTLLSSEDRKGVRLLLQSAETYMQYEEALQQAAERARKPSFTNKLVRLFWQHRGGLKSIRVLGFPLLTISGNLGCTDYFIAGVHIWRHRYEENLHLP